MLLEKALESASPLVGDFLERVRFKVFLLIVVKIHFSVDRTLVDFTEAVANMPYRSAHAQKCFLEKYF